MSTIHPRAVYVLVLCSCAIGQTTPPPSSELLRNAGGASEKYSAVGQFRGPRTCTASLIDPSGAGADDARAWVLTAGHCISLDAYGVIRNQPLTAQVTFHYFIDTPDRRVVIRSRATGWSTMKGTDIALVELDATLGDLRARGLAPLRLASAQPDAGAGVFFTGIPLSPVPSEQQFLRRGSCTNGSPEQLLESSWIWHGHVSNDCPDLYAGASGSPLFDEASGDIAAVIGTGTILNFEEGPDYDCQTNRPCVVRAGGTVMQKNTGYASPVPQIAPCFDRANVLDTARPGCPLDPGYQLVVNSTPNEVKPVTDGVPAAWNAQLAGTPRYYSFKRFAAGEGDCTNPAGYGAPVAVASAPVIRDPVGSVDGYYFLCVIAGDTPTMDATWQKSAHASTRFKRLDSQPPVVPLDYEIAEAPGGYNLLNTSGGEGTSGLGIAMYKLGPLAATDCADLTGYRGLLSIAPVIRTSEFPLRMCWRMSDRAGNFTTPVGFDFGPPTIFPNAIQNGASTVRGAVSPGAVFRVDTFNLTGAVEFSSTPVPTLAGVAAAVVDASGRSLPVNLTMAGPLYLEAVLPANAAPGSAVLRVQPPQGPALTQSFTVRGAAPGLYYDQRSEGPVGYASDGAGNTFVPSSCGAGGFCTITQLPVSSTPGGLTMVLYGTGFRTVTGAVTIRIGTHTLTDVAVSRHPQIAGVDELRFQIPHEFPLRLFQTISAETADGVTNLAWIYLD